MPWITVQTAKNIWAHLPSALCTSRRLAAVSIAPDYSKSQFRWKSMDIVPCCRRSAASVRVRRLRCEMGDFGCFQVGGCVEMRSGGERTERRCVRSAANLERIAVEMIAVMTVITGIPRFDRNEEGRTKERSCPKKPTPNGPHSGEGKSRRAKSFGMKWNETAFWRVCKLLKIWWPGTESNRRRQPFQGCYPR
jgi:hypothetical protein